MLAEANLPFRPRRLLFLFAALALPASLWILVAGYGAAGPQPGIPWSPGDGWRRALLALCSVLLSARILLPELRLHDRWRGWSPALATAGALLAYQIGLAVLGTGAEQPLGGPLDFIAALLLVSGGVVSGSAYVSCRQRQALHLGRTGLAAPRLRRRVRHPAYLGDLTCALGAALLTRNPFALALPVAHALFLLRVAIPELEWRRSVRRPARVPHAPRNWELIPFVY